VKKQKSIKVGLSNIQNISVVGNQYYLYTNDSVFLINENGNIIDKSTRNLNKGSYFDSENNYSITPEGKVFKSSELLFDLSDKLSSRKKTAKFLSKSEDTFLSCIVDPTRLSYSDGIFIIGKDKYSLFLFLVGIPAGLYADNHYLWYLCNRSSPGSYGILQKYDDKTGKLLLEIEIPVIDPVGIYVKSDLCYVYSNYSHELVTLTLGGK
jgi:hypothetical protein